jgi:hypothetical protein
MADFVVDKSLDVLLRQLNDYAPGRDKSSDGSIGDTAHQSRTSAHNPQDTADSADGNDPDNQVDARDFTHDPAHGADMGNMTEDIRKSRDPRVELVIWNSRQFSSYPTSSRKAWEWGPYSGTNDHSRHAHVQVRDVGNDNTTPWKVFTMSAQTDDIILRWSRGVDTRTDGVSIEPVKWRVRDEAWQVKTDTALTELNTLVKAQAEQIFLLTQIIQGLSIPAPAPVDPDTVKLAMLDPAILAAFANSVQDEDHRRSAA